MGASHSVKLLTTRSDVETMLANIYPSGVAAEGWEEVAIDSEFDPAPPFELAYVQLSNGKQTYVIEGPLASKAQGRKLNLPPMLRAWAKDSKVRKFVSTLRAERDSFKLGGVGVIRGVEVDTEVCDWLFEENRLRHGLKDVAKDHLGLYMKAYSDYFGWIPAGKKKAIVPSMRQVVKGNDETVLEIASMRKKAKKLRDGATKKVVPEATALEKAADKLEENLMPWTGEKMRARALEYAALDPYATFGAAKFFQRQLKLQGIWKWYATVERPLANTLHKMEERGVRLDVKSVDAIRHKVRADVLRTQHVFRASVDNYKLNLRSQPQMQALLFKKLRWPVLERNDLTDAQEEAGQEEGNPKLNRAALDVYESRGFKLATLLKAYRGLSTLHDVFLMGALVKRDAATGLIHTRFKQSRTVTGRLSSGDRQAGKMNLQNIPARKEKDPYRLRQFFLPTKPDHVLIVADYSQVELYIIAQLSQDKRMIQAFKRGEDLHSLTASKIFNLKLPKEPSSWDPTSSAYKDWKKACVEWKEKYDTERKDAKIVNFGLNYGMSAFKLAMDNDLEVEEAEKWVEGYFELYPGVQKFMKRTIKFAYTHGYVPMISGRRRRLDEWLNDRDKKVRARGERQAINAPIQGGAADIIKVAMNAIELGDKYKCKWLPASLLPMQKRVKELGVEQLLQVHDELVMQCPIDNAEEGRIVTQKIMEAPFAEQVFTDVKIQASVGVGPNWASAKV